MSKKRLQKKYGLGLECVSLNGVSAEILTPHSDNGITLLYLHGGGYFMGSLYADRENGARLATQCGCKVVVVDYRLSPENPYPAALEDAAHCYRELLKRDPKSRIIVCGDSAGGGLALALALSIRDNQLGSPLGVICISPWTDLTGSGRSIETNHKRDVWLTRKHVEYWAPWYYGTQDPKLPYISPVFGDLEGLPPMLLLVGDQEILLDDSTRVFEAAKGAGVRAELHVGLGMQHNWLLGMPFLKESKSAWGAVVQFVSRVSPPN